MRDLHVVRHRLGIHGETVVLGGDLDLSRGHVADRMIGAAMTELELVGLRTERSAEHLVTQADAERRHVAVDHRARVADRVVQRGGIARAVAEEDAVRLHRQQIGGRRRGREDPDLAAVRGQTAQDVALHAQIVGGDAQRTHRAPLRLHLEPGGGLVVLGAPVERRRASDRADQVAALHAGGRLRLRDERVRVDRPRADDAAHDAGRAQQSRQRAGVDTGDADDAVRREIVVQRPGGPPVAGDRRIVAHDESGHARCAGLPVLRLGNAVVSDLRTGHRDDLPGVRRIRQDLLITRHARVEDHLAGVDACSAHRAAGVPGTVLEGEHRLHRRPSGSSRAATRIRSVPETSTSVAHGR